MSYSHVMRDATSRRQREEMSPASDDVAVSMTQQYTQSQATRPQQQQRHYLDDDIAGEEAASDTDAVRAAPRVRRNCVQRSADQVLRVVHFVIPPGGILSSASNMAATAIGAGILGLPSATDATGLAMSMILLVVMTVYTVFSMYLLAYIAQKTRIKSFEGMARWLLPQYNYAFGMWIAFIRCFYAFSACVAYVISMGNCMSPLFAEAHRQHPDNAAIAYLNTLSGNRLLTSLIWLCLMLPLLIPKHFNSLRVVSMFAVMFMVFFSFVIIIHSCLNGLPVLRHKIVMSDANAATDDPDTVYLFRTGNKVITRLGTFLFAYLVQITCMEVYWDMNVSVRTPGKFAVAASMAMFVCMLVYALVSAFGYLDFGSQALYGKSILLMYNPLREPLVLVAYIGVMVKLCVAYALLGAAARNAIYYLNGWQLKYHTPHKKTRSPTSNSDASNDSGNNNSNNNSNSDNMYGEPTRADASNGQARTATAARSASRDGAMDDVATVKKPAGAAVAAGNAPDGGAAADAERNPDELLLQADEDVLDDATDDTTFIDNIPFVKHLIVVVALSIAALVCGLFIPMIDTVFGFAGSISGGFIAYVCPALYFMYSGGFTVRQVGWWRYLLTYSLLPCGVVGIVWGTCGTIYAVIVG